jgi:hypothetical protein
MKLNEVYHLVIYCLNCIRHDQNSMHKTGVSNWCSGMHRIRLNKLTLSYVIPIAVTIAIIHGFETQWNTILLMVKIQCDNKEPNVCINLDKSIDNEFYHWTKAW